MISISLSHVHLVLAARTIFRDLTWEIQHDQKIGLVGPNGAGKSSLMKLIMGEFAAEPGGAVTRAKGVTVGYLPQQPEFPSGAIALDLALGGIPRMAEIDQELQAIEEKLSRPEVYNNPKELNKALTVQHQLLEEFDSHGGDNYPVRVRELLLGLGLPESEFHKPIRVLSGGQKKLIGLARLLLSRPAVMLLDEPDNHLDIPGKAYLEKLIMDYPGAVVLISHDRYLLDACVVEIAEIEDGRLTTFSGCYTDYIMIRKNDWQGKKSSFKSSSVPFIGWNWH